MVEASLDVCEDCYQFAANGFDGMDLPKSRENEIREGFAQWDGGINWVAGAPQGFSWYGCHMCRDLSGGDRFELFGLT